MTKIATFLSCLAFILLVECSLDNTSHEKPQQQQLDASSKYVMATLRAKWSETPLLLEASEYIFRSDPTKFWSFVEQISNQPNLFHNFKSNLFEFFRYLCDD